MCSSALFGLAIATAFIRTVWSVGFMKVTDTVYWRKSKQKFGGDLLAEREGFEPSVHFQLCNALQCFANLRLYLLFFASLGILGHTDYGQSLSPKKISVLVDKIPG